MITKENFEKFIETLCSLKENWHDRKGGGTYQKESFNLLKEKVFDAKDKLSIPIPYLFPTFQKNVVRLEWDNDLEMDLNLNTNKIIYISIDGMEDKEFDFNEQWDFILTTLWELR